MYNKKVLTSKVKMAMPKYRGRVA